MFRSTRSTRPLSTALENLPLSEVFKNIESSAQSEVLSNIVEENISTMNNLQPNTNNVNANNSTNDENPENMNGNISNVHPSDQPNGLNMGELQNVINEMIQNALINYLPASLYQGNQIPITTQPLPQSNQPLCDDQNQPPYIGQPNVASNIPLIQQKRNISNHNNDLLSSFNINNKSIPIINDRVTSIVMPEKFSV
uniref:Reverse transcriptase n=1 Tax=Strongyloides stercoralis TaxID=6248 RepID=A0A0K0ETD9_STRER